MVFKSVLHLLEFKDTLKMHCGTYKVLVFNCKNFICNIAHFWSILES